MPKEEFMQLQHSESVVAQMSATVFAALVQKVQLSDAIENELIEKSVAIAIRLAVRADELVKSDEEWVRKDTSSAYLG